MDYSRQCLSRHISHLELLHAFVTALDDLEWARIFVSAKRREKGKVDKTAMSLVKDLAALLRDANSLSKHFDAATDLLITVP